MTFLRISLLFASTGHVLRYGSIITKFNIMIINNYTYIDDDIWSVFRVI